MNRLMQRCSGFLAALLLCLGLVQATMARDLTTAENTALVELVRRFDGVMKAQDYSATIRMIPPRILQYIVKSSGRTEDEVIKAFADAMTQTLAKADIQSFGMDLAKADHKELSDGTPYVLVPTETVVAIKGGDKIAVRSHSLAMMDENEWHLMRISDPQQRAILIQVYPGYKGVEFPSDKMEILKE